MVKVRYRHPAQPALVQSWGDGLAKITFMDPVRAATPGQSAVFYDYEGCVIGGGKISSVLG
jgi:tRNA-specific 2-thiouridylase